MSKKKNTGGIVYSTDPEFKVEAEPDEQAETLAASKQALSIRLDTKNRGGKAVTLITGFVGNTNDLDELGKKIKNFCGTGGSVKDGQIIIQGDQRDKILQWLIKNDFKKSRKI